MSTRNRAASLGRALDSVLNQKHPSLELIVVDDGSTDAADDVLAAYRDDCRLRILKNSTNIGLPASLNRGIAASSGELIARIDDDYWDNTNKLTLQTDYMARHADCGVLGTGYVDEWGGTITNLPADADSRRQMLFRCPFCPPSVMFRRDAFDVAGGHDETLPYAEDWDLWLRIGRDWQLVDVTLIKQRTASTLSERHFLPSSRWLKPSAGSMPMLTRGPIGRAPTTASAGFLFALFPPGGRVHALMRRVFLRAFGLGEPAKRG